ncbi:lactate utilization protein C [Niallia oryzisoli]|uniref:Lactate utilization protein C n=1 Tax=Niallia oryzisoli TaxID=1737571 RepID=A0ABZ2CA09_9BACI
MGCGQVYHRESFLNNVAAKLNRSRITKVIKPAWSKIPQYEVGKNLTQDELLKVLRNQCKLIHTDIIETTSKELPQQLLKVFKEYDVNKAISWDDERYKTYGLDEQLFSKLYDYGIDFHMWNPMLKEKNIEIAEQADVGITFSDITLAESGTVVLFTDKNKGRLVSLLPKTYIAIIPKSTIVPRMTQATTHISRMVQNGIRISSCIDFVTGPSNSADIELNLIVGVHGPIKATYIVLNDR